MDDDESLTVACLGDAATVDLFRASGWSSHRDAGVVIAAGATHEEARLALETVLAPRVGLVLLTATVADSIRATSAVLPVTIVELLPQEGSRVSCTLYDPTPYEKWPAPVTQEEEESDLCAKASDVVEEVTVEVVHGKSDERVKLRIEALVQALFRLVALSVDEEEGGLFRLEVFNAATQEIAELMASADQGARFFARALNKQRTGMIDVGALFPFLAGLMLSFLDRSQKLHDAESILTATMLAQSFYRRRSTEREYLKSAIQSHPVWADSHFWRVALDHLVKKQQSLSTTEEEVDTSCLDGGGPSWETLFTSTEAEENLPLFSQLGGVVHAMLEYGVQCEAVLAFVDAVATEHGLPAERRKLIDDHIIAHHSASGQIPASTPLETAPRREDHYMS